MQAHTQLEFGASLKQGASSAERLDGEGWLTVRCEADPSRDDRLSFYVNGRTKNNMANGDPGHNFKTEPWVRHAVQFEGNTAPALVVMCNDGASDYETYITVAGAHGHGGVPSRTLYSQTRVRSLGYVGSFLREYGSAADLLCGVRSSRLLAAVAAPGPGKHAAGGTFVPVEDITIDTSCVPLNSTQRRAVANLSGGLDSIVGPPGLIIHREVSPSMPYVIRIRTRTWRVSKCTPSAT